MLNAIGEKIRKAGGISSGLLLEAWPTRQVPLNDPILAAGGDCSLSDVRGFDFVLNDTFSEGVLLFGTHLIEDGADDK